MANNVQEFDLAFEQLSLDDIPDLPEFGAWPAGTYIATANLERKMIKMQAGETPCVELTLKMNAVQAIDPAESAPVEGSETSILYNLQNEFGLGSFKKLAKPVVGYFGCAGNIGAVVEAVQDIPCVVTLTAKKDKKDTLRNNIAEIVFG